MVQNRLQTRVGVIGLGIIGSQVTAHLRTAGFSVALWNRTPKDEPNFLPSPAAVAETSDLIQLFVADQKAVFGVLAADRADLTVARRRERRQQAIRTTIG
jgi:3-hydroxyisobutyrate dehydrogenase-like beta-hydroxyacid dehydrogenase